MAEALYNFLGGSLYNAAKNIEAIGTAGNTGIQEFVAKAKEARTNGADIWESIQYGASNCYSGFMDATRSWANQRVNSVADKLTPAQQAYYRALMFEAFAGIAVAASMVATWVLPKAS
jgi:conjugal transfer mating pair stabilization protein TraG